MPLNATPGDADANSYATVEEYLSYIEDHYGAAVVDETAVARALIIATSMLDILPGAWSGTASSALQALGWPRQGMLTRNGFPIPPDVLPRALKSAVIELAKTVGEGSRTSDNDIVNLGIKSISAGPVSISFGGKTVEETNKEIVPGANAAELAARLMVPDFVRALLVPSWLNPTVAQIQAGNEAKFLFVNVGGGSPEE